MSEPRLGRREGLRRLVGASDELGHRLRQGPPPRPSAGAWQRAPVVIVGGGVAGHNGLRSVAAALGTKDFYRVRIGIGRPPGRMSPASFVLESFTAAERTEVPVTCDVPRVIEFYSR